MDQNKRSHFGRPAFSNFFPLLCKIKGIVSNASCLCAFISVASCNRNISTFRSLSDITPEGCELHSTWIFITQLLKCISVRITCHCDGCFQCNFDYVSNSDETSSFHVKYRLLAMDLNVSIKKYFI